MKTLETYPVELQAIEPLARDVALFRLVPVGPRVPPRGTAGAHVDVHLPGGWVRPYSLVLDGDEPHLSIAVKRALDSRGGSRTLHESVKVGETLAISAPRNGFPLVEDAPFSLLLAGGIGITPIWSMVRRLETLGRRYALHYACRSRADIVFRRELPTSCEQGVCGACETRVLDGTPAHGCQVLSAEERAAGQTMMICCGGSRTARLVLDI